MYLAFVVALLKVPVHLALQTVSIYSSLSSVFNALLFNNQYVRVRMQGYFLAGMEPFGSLSVLFIC